MISHHPPVHSELDFAGGAFRHRNVEAAGVRFHIVEGGQGPTVVLIAGFPQSYYAWRRVMPILARQFHVIAVDLPGQGDSEKPLSGYDTRTAGQRVHALLQTLGEKNYVFVGHDIGAWVGYPYAHQFQDELRGLVLLDGNIPGVTLQPTLTLGHDNWRNWHFLFNPIPDLPEALLQGRERILIEWFFSRKTANAPATFSEADIDEYERAYQTLGGMRGMLGYYRAVLEDIEQNKEYMGRKLDLPVLALGGDVGSAPDLYERVRPLGHDVRGGVIAQSGHYIPEEQPEALSLEITRFIESLPSCPA
jgi:pimeloyl-ACP methyl ester carboxylesterase